MTEVKTMIAGTGSYVPEKLLTNADLERMVDTSDEWIRTRTGIEVRHVSAPEQATSDLAFIASTRALESAGVAPGELGLIIVATVTPDHIFPNTACILQTRLGADRAFCFDLEAACSGLLYSMTVADALLKANPLLKYALVLGAEKLSGIVNWEDRNTCVLFGDGAGAVVLKAVDGGEGSRGILGSELHSDGACAKLLMLEAGGSRCPVDERCLAEKRNFIHMEGREVFKQAVTSMVESSQRLLERRGVKVEDLRWVVPHQANARIIKAVAQRLGAVREQVYVNVCRYGNTSSASIGLCLDEMNRGGLLKPGDRVLLTSFGAGMTWGSVLIEW